MIKKKRHNRGRSPIGLDLGDCVIKAAQLDQGSSPCLTGAVAFDRLTPGAAFGVDEADRLREVLERRGFVGHQVVLGIPGKHALTRILTLPVRGQGVPLDAIARSEMAHEHRCEMDTMEMAYWDLPKPARAASGTHVMAVACAHEQADAMITPLQQVGFDVVALDMEGWAMARACRSLVHATEGIVAVVDIGWDSTTLVLLHESVVVYERSIFGMGIRQLRETLEREQQFSSEVIDYLLCDIGFELDTRGQGDDWRLMLKSNAYLESSFEPIVREMNLSMDYAHSQYPHSPVEQVFILGGGAGVPGLDEYLTNLLETRVTAVRPRDVIQGTEQFTDIAELPSMILAMGLALPRTAEPSTRKEAA